MCVTVWVLRYKNKKNGDRGTIVFTATLMTIRCSVVVVASFFVPSCSLVIISTIWGQTGWKSEMLVRRKSYSIIPVQQYI